MSIDNNKILFRNQACPAPNCGSSDALQVYEDLHAHCYSCGAHFKRVGGDLISAETPGDDERFYRAAPRRVSNSEVANIQAYECRGFKSRGITRSICEFYGVKCRIENDEITDHYYPYQLSTGGIAKGYKHRVVATKFFEWIGKSGGLFGRNSFNGDGRRIVICEGEVDALAVAQMWMDVHKKIYPVIALSSSTGTKELIPERVWLRSFDEVCLAFDMDAAGEEATQKAIRIIGGDKVRIVRFPVKDANQTLVEYGYRELHRCILDAEKYIPAGIVTGEKVWEQMVDLAKVPFHPYPPCLQGLNTKLKGMRRGEITLFTSGTGAGKTTMTKEIALHVLETTDAKVGIISLEESPAEAGTILSCMAMNRNASDDSITQELLKEGFDKVFKEERVLLLDHGGETIDESIMDTMIFMALSGCHYIILDHITVMVSEGAGDLTGNEATDKVMNLLRKFVKAHNVWLGVISHLRKTLTGTKSFEDGRLPTIDDIRGSGSIKQVSYDIVGFARNLIAQSDFERNLIQVRVLKCRKTGLTGDVPGCRYNYDTGRLQYAGESEEPWPAEEMAVVKPTANLNKEEAKSVPRVVDKQLPKIGPTVELPHVADFEILPSETKANAIKRVPVVPKRYSN